MAITIHQESKEIDNGIEENPAYNMPFYTEIKCEDMEEQKQEISTPTPSETDQEKESVPLHSLHKAANPYRLPIRPTCRPQKDNGGKLLKLKEHKTIGARRQHKKCLI